MNHTTPTFHYVCVQLSLGEFSFVTNSGECIYLGLTCLKIVGGRSYVWIQLEELTMLSKPSSRFQGAGSPGKEMV
jgi:hypothetical protein